MSREVIASSIVVTQFILVYICITTVHCASLLSFGANNPNDVAATGITDDSAAKISTIVPLTFYGTQYTDLWVSDFLITRGTVEIEILSSTNLEVTFEIETL